MIIVRDEEQVETSLATGELMCPACGGRLRRHGWTRERSVRTRSGQRRLRPARVRCAASDCGRTQVLLPAWCVPGRSADAETIGSALTAAATGVGHRRIAARLGLPADTVRGWLRAARSHADWLYARACRVQGLVRTGAEDPCLPRPRSPLGNAVAALGAAAAAIRRSFGATLPTPAWSLIVTITGGRLLRPLRRFG